MAVLPSPDVHAASPVSAARRDEILQELVETASSAVNAQFNAFTTRLSDALLRAAAGNTDPADAKRCLDAAHLLKKNRYPFYYVASARLSTVLQQELAMTGDPSRQAGSTAGALKPLPPDFEIDKKLTLQKASRAIENEHAERLAALGIRLAHLFGRPALEFRQNPFRPHVFLAAIHDAWCEFQLDAESHHLVFPMLQPDLFLDMAPILHALNMTLVRCGILPRLSDPGPVQISRPTEADGEDELARQLRHLLAENAHAAGPDASLPPAGAFPALFGPDLLPAADRKALLAYLAGMRNSKANGLLLPQIRQQAPQALTPADAHVFDLLTRIFAAVFSDVHIPAEIKGWIGSLQVPVLEAALTERDFFFHEDHPARRTIELLAHLGVGWDRTKGAADPLHQAILRNVKRVHSDRRVAAFSDAVSDLEAFVEQEEKLSAEALAAPIAQALQRENLLQAGKAARQDVALRVDSGEVVAFVETFLEDKWVAVLTLAYGMRAHTPQAVHDAVQAMDDLIWSVKPKITLPERKELLAKLPSILAALNKWLDQIHWDDAGRAAFFAELAECHASIMRAPLKLSPRRQVELALAAAQHATERRLQRQADRRPEPVPDEFTQRVQQLECGTWLAFVRKDGTVFRARLAWVSPMRSLYLFATRERQEALSLSAEVLAQALRNQRAQIILATGLVERVLAEALGVESANSDMAAVKPAA